MYLSSISKTAIKDVKVYQRSADFFCLNRTFSSVTKLYILNRHSNVPTTINPTNEKKIFGPRYIGTCEEGRGNIVNKKVNIDVIDETKKLELNKLPSIYASLSKWYLTWFVVMTADAGYCLTPIMYDALMDRTAVRPLVTKSITPEHALAFAAVCG